MSPGDQSSRRHFSILRIDGRILLGAAALLLAGFAALAPQLDRAGFLHHF